MVETTADQETDPAVESGGESQAQLQRSVDFSWLEKESEQETNWGFLSLSKINGNDLPTKYPMYNKNVPAKTLATQRVLFCMRTMTC